MRTKELLEARWKFIIFALLILLIVILASVTYPLVKTLAIPPGSLPSSVQSLLQSRIASYNEFAWGEWFQQNGVTFLALLAAVLGCGLIAGEVSKGTIFFLLSKPVSRERILLTKYGVSAAIILAIALLASIAIEVMSLIMGYPQNILSLLIATVLIWLGTLFTLGLALLFSVVFTDIVRPLIFALLITIVLSLLGLVPHMQDWSLVHYWSSSDAYLNGSFPLKEYIVCLVAAVLPLLGALALFRRKAY